MSGGDAPSGEPEANEGQEAATGPAVSKGRQRRKKGGSSFRDSPYRKRLEVPDSPSPLSPGKEDREVPAVDLESMKSLSLSEESMRSSLEEIKMLDTESSDPTDGQAEMPNLVVPRSPYQMSSLIVTLCTIVYMAYVALVQVDAEASCTLPAILFVHTILSFSIQCLRVLMPEGPPRGVLGTMTQTFHHTPVLLVLAILLFDYWSAELRALKLGRSNNEM
eukprot:CAMPEP_0119132308 /NCGR_PEP_ID=MMETSP1310-20130426/11772_1 /TAXON_ID=464262 /ORGANISM="Genus nov. species nov., Strain RCC2339" /LENGTH=219 /DNA_ID=CAMNT_0007122935 /DNA_START=212 /DNA_END=872 /DNA_ORIENTATION=+